MNTYSPAPGIDVLASSVPIPGFGSVPVNAFVIKGAEPILVDTGVSIQHEEFRSTLEQVVDPGDLRWIWLTHTDFDHIGTLHELLAAHPRIRVVTTFLGAGIMSLTAPLPLDRVYFVNQGETVTLGGRRLTAVKPPVFDNPSTTGFYDHASGALFSSDCFGAMLQSIPSSAAELSERDLRDGQVTWATLDAPWLHKVDRGRFAAELEDIRRARPSLILSSHLPPAPGALLDRMLGALGAAPDAQPFMGPNQAAFEQMLAGMAGAGA